MAKSLPGRVDLMVVVGYEDQRSPAWRLASAMCCEMYCKPCGFSSPTPEVCISAPICQSELSLLEGNGHEFHIDARPRGSSAKNIDGQSFRFAVFDLGKWWEVLSMGNAHLIGPALCKSGLAEQQRTQQKCGTDVMRNV